MTKGKDEKEKKTPVKKTAKKAPAKKKSTRPVGRPPKYKKWLTERGLQQITAWAREGLYDYQVAKKMGIGRSTFSEWLLEYTELVEALEEGRDYADRQIENALYKSAMGYEYVEETEVNVGKGKMEIDKRVIKTQAPSVNAQIFWLKNRQPDRWRDKQEIDNKHSGTINVVFDEETEKWSE